MLRIANCFKEYFKQYNTETGEMLSMSRSTTKSCSFTNGRSVITEFLPLSLTQLSGLTKVTIVSEVLNVVSLKRIVFWAAQPCRSEELKHFGGKYHSHIQGRRVIQIAELSF
jgi:hypothetical protein